MDSQPNDSEHYSSDTGLADDSSHTPNTSRDEPDTMPLSHDDTETSSDFFHSEDDEMDFQKKKNTVDYTKINKFEVLSARLQNVKQMHNISSGAYERYLAFQKSRLSAPKSSFKLDTDQSKSSDARSVCSSSSSSYPTNTNPTPPSSHCSKTSSSVFSSGSNCFNNLIMPSNENSLIFNSNINCKPSLAARRGFTPPVSSNESCSSPLCSVSETKSTKHGDHADSHMHNSDPSNKCTDVKSCSSSSSLYNLRLPSSSFGSFQGPLFSEYKDIVDLKTGTLNFEKKAVLSASGVNFSEGKQYKICLAELEMLGELGKGNYGTVYKVLHRPTGVIMALKEIRLCLDEQTFQQIIMELEILHKAHSPYIVEFYGAFFTEGCVSICIEYMDAGSIDQLYANGVEEDVLAKITLDVVKGLMTLKKQLNIIHRDVKPTNILMNRNGQTKLCDFGVSGNLVASMAKTNIGCQSYYAPERIMPDQNDAKYGIEADIWSLGISIVEIAIGRYPYPYNTYSSIFAQLHAICKEDPPMLPQSRYSPEATDFVRKCLLKNPRKRPCYQDLLEHPWLKKYADLDVPMTQWVAKALIKKQPQSEPKPALHTVDLTEAASFADQNLMS